MGPYTSSRIAWKRKKKKKVRLYSRSSCVVAGFGEVAFSETQSRRILRRFTRRIGANPPSNNRRVFHLLLLPLLLRSRMPERPCKARASADTVAEPKPWLSDSRRRRDPSPAPAPAPAEAGSAANVDPVLFESLVEMFPLVESLMDRKASSSYSRRASVVYTPAPSQPRKAAESKSGRSVHSVPAKQRRDLDNAQRSNYNGSSDGLSISSSRSVESDIFLKNQEELNILRERVNELQRKIQEKEEALITAENEINKRKAACSSIEELKSQMLEKDSLVKSINLELNNTKIDLADKQANLERLTWEAQMSNRKIDELQGEIISMDYEITTLMKIYEKFCSNDSVLHSDADFHPYHLEPLPVIDDINDVEIGKMEEARTTYLAAVAAAKENPTEELLAMAAQARLRLQALVIWQTV